MSVRGFIFDLDGTLVDSGLDFDQIRAEMGLERGASILEALERLPAPEAARCRAILARHEEAGARRAAPMPGAARFLAELADRGLRRAVVTRNTRRVAVEVVARFRFDVERVVAREDGPVKPDPATILELCRWWSVDPHQVVVVGDFRFDVEAGHAAGAQTVLFTRGRDPGGLPGADLADFHLRAFDDVEALLARLCE